MRRGKGNGKMINMKCEFCGKPASLTATKSGLKTKSMPTKLCQQCDKKAKDAIDTAIQDAFKELKTKLEPEISKFKIKFKIR